MGGRRYEISFADIITEDICGGARGKSGRADRLGRFDLIKRPHLINPRSWRLPLVIRSPLVTGPRFIHISYGILIRKNKERLRTLNPPKYLLCRRCSKLIPRSLITRDDVFSHTRTIGFERFLEELAAFLPLISSFSLYTAAPFSPTFFQVEFSFFRTAELWRRVATLSFSLPIISSTWKFRV